MTDNSSLIPSQSAPNFAQQGQLDWLAVARAPVAFTLEALARYGKAGVDGFTVGIARAVCSQFDLKPPAQKRLEESISKLKTIHSFGKIAWFGFGLKHIIDTLLETEQGASFVALSGCLTASYDADYASQVYRSICQIKGAPKSLTPSLRQWNALVRVCAGSLANSQFPHLLIGFERLLATHLQDRRCRTPPESETLAKAIIILGSLSKGILRGATFSGGLDCAWIAAMAEWMLCLGVEIKDSSGNTLYRSKSLSSSGIAHVVINIHGPLSNASSDLTHKTFCIPSGEDLLRRTPGIFDSFKARSAVKQSVPWTDILNATFGEKTMLSLLHAPSNAFAVVVFSTLSLLNPNEPKYDTVHTSFYEPNGSQHDIELLEWVIWRLPELRPCFEGSISLTSESAHLDKYWQLIGEACGCRGCSKEAYTVFMLFPEKEFCLKILVFTIVEYLLLLFRLSIDPLVLPSCNGLRFLYDHKARKRVFQMQLDYLGLLTFVATEFKLPGIFEIFTGHSFDDNGNDQSKSALSSNGICIFLDIFLDIDVPPLRINTVHVIPGYIEFEDSQCRTAVDIFERSEERSADILELSFERPLPNLQYDGKDLSYNMVVQHKVHQTDICVGYQMCLRGGWVELEGLCSIMSNAMQKTTSFNCTTWCQDGGHETDKRFAGQKATLSDKTSINDQWVAVVLTRTGEGPISDEYKYTLQALTCCYPQMYLDLLLYRPRIRACLVRINNCPKCLLMYAAETMFDTLSESSGKWGSVWTAKGTITIRRRGAEDVKIELQGRELEIGGIPAPVDAGVSRDDQRPSKVGAIPRYPNLPLDHDPVVW